MPKKTLPIPGTAKSLNARTAAPTPSARVRRSLTNFSGPSSPQPISIIESLFASYWAIPTNTLPLTLCKKELSIKGGNMATIPILKDDHALLQIIARPSTHAAMTQQIILTQHRHWAKLSRQYSTRKHKQTRLKTGRGFCRRPVVWGCGREKGCAEFRASARGRGGCLGASLGIHNRPEAKSLSVGHQTGG